MKIMLTGNLTICGSRSWTRERIDEMMGKVVSLELRGQDGRPVVLRGRLQRSRNGTVTANVVLNVKSAEVVIDRR
jgi:hypothetical protein